MGKLESEIINIIAKEEGLNIAEIKASSTLHDLGIDSLSSLELLAILEEEYDINIPEDDLSNTNSIKELTGVVSKALKKKEGDMKKDTFYKWMFFVAGAYDVFLGALFFFFYKPLYGSLGLVIPNRIEYVQLPSLLVFLFGVMFFYVYKDMYKNLDMVKVGVLFKISYVSLAFFYYFKANLHYIFMLFAWIDVIFLALFVMFLSYVTNKGTMESSSK